MNSADQKFDVVEVEDPINDSILFFLVFIHHHAFSVIGINDRFCCVIEEHTFAIGLLLSVILDEEKIIRDSEYDFFAFIFTKFCRD